MKMSGSVEDFEEDVVIEGSELHRMLLQMGFTDFETVNADPREKEGIVLTENQRKNDNGVFEKLYQLYNKISKLQDFNLFQEKLKQILLLEPLLDDHAYNLHNLVSEEKCTLLQKFCNWLPLGGMCAATATSVLFKQDKILTTILVSLTGLYLHNKHSKWSSVHNLKKLVGYQNALYSNVKKCLKILHNDFGIRKSTQNKGNSFLEFKRNQLKFLVPLLSSLIKCLEHISLLHYRLSQNIHKLLSDSKRSENLLTPFDNESFLIKGEVTYDSLKNLYYTYLLTQSEMLHLLATLYWEKISNENIKIPEDRLNNLIQVLTEPVKNHNNRLSKILNDYNSSNVKIVHQKFRGTNAKWQDIYLQLDSTLQKLQSSYFSVSSLMHTIDNSENNSNDEQLIQILSDKMNEAHKQIESARSFVDLGILLLMKKKQSIKRKDDLDIQTDQTFTDVSKPSHIIVQDSEPEILDEVFEEYIKDEYLKPLCEDEDDDFTYDREIGKMLTANYMKELKDVLVDKYKLMSEREARALQRMLYSKMVESKDKKKNERDEDLEQKIPVPPPCPNFEFGSKVAGEKKKEIGRCDEGKKVPVPTPRIRNENGRNVEEGDGNVKLNKSSEMKKHVKSINNLTEEEKEDMAMRFSLGACLPKKPTVTFLNVEEETFAGSGENTDEEVIKEEDESDS